MSSRRESLILALVAALETPPVGITKPAGLTVHRFAMLPIEQDTLPALVVYWTACDPPGNDFLHQPDADRLLEYHLKVRLEARASGDPIDQALEPYCQYLRQVVFSDPSFGGLAFGTREDGIQVDAVDGGNRICAAAACDFTISFYEEPFSVTQDPAIGGVLVHASYPTQPTAMTLEVQP